MKTFITVYDTFQELCNDPDLTESMVVMTLGDANIDDGKGATYKIISEKANGEDTLPIRRGINPLSARIISSYLIPKNIKSVHMISSTVNAIGDSVNLSYEKTDEIHKNINDITSHIDEMGTHVSSLSNDMDNMKEDLITVVNDNIPDISKNIADMKSHISTLTNDVDTVSSTGEDAIDILMDMISEKRISNVLEIRDDFKFVNTFSGDTYAISSKYGTEQKIEVTIDKSDIEDNPWIVPIEFIFNTKITTITNDHYSVTYNRDNNMIFTFDLSKSDTGVIKL